MPGHQRHARSKPKTAFGLKRPHHGQRMRHQRRLSIGRQRQFFLRAFPHQLAELLAQSIIHFLEDVAGSGKGIGQVAAHADSLAPLAGKDEGKGHDDRSITVKKGQAARMAARPRLVNRVSSSGYWRPSPPASNGRVPPKSSPPIPEGWTHQW